MYFTCNLHVIYRYFTWNYMYYNVFYWNGVDSISFPSCLQPNICLTSEKMYFSSLGPLLLPLPWYQLTEREQGPWQGQPRQPGLPRTVESPKKCQARSEISFPSSSALQFALNIQQMSVICDLSLGPLLTFSAFCFVPFSPVRQWFCKACWPAYWGAWLGLVQSRQQWSPCEKSLQIISSVRNSEIF